MTLYIKLIPLILNMKISFLSRCQSCSKRPRRIRKRTRIWQRRRPKSGRRNQSQRRTSRSQFRLCRIRRQNHQNRHRYLRKSWRNPQQRRNPQRCIFPKNDRIRLGPHHESTHERNLLCNQSRLEHYEITRIRKNHQHFLWIRCIRKLRTS